MKVKLLKKIRKRFVWYKNETSLGDGWYCIDKQENIEEYIYYFRVSSYDKMLLIHILNKMNMQYLWVEQSKNYFKRKEKFRIKNIKSKIKQHENNN